MLLYNDPHRRPLRRELGGLKDIPRPQGPVVPLGLFEQWKGLAEQDITALAVMRPDVLPPVVDLPIAGILFKISDWSAEEEAKFDRCVALMRANDLTFKRPQDRDVLISLDELSAHLGVPWQQTFRLALKGLLPKPETMVYRCLYFTRAEVHAWERSLPVLPVGAGSRLPA